MDTLSRTDAVIALHKIVKECYFAISRSRRMTESVMDYPSSDGNPTGHTVKFCVEQDGRMYEIRVRDMGAVR
jgi:hypothetical protein